MHTRPGFCTDNTETTPRMHIMHKASPSRIAWLYGFLGTGCVRVLHESRVLICVASVRPSLLSRAWRRRLERGARTCSHEFVNIWRECNLYITVAPSNTNPSSKTPVGNSRKGRHPRRTRTVAQRAAPPAGARAHMRSLLSPPLSSTDHLPISAPS